MESQNRDEDTVGESLPQREQEEREPAQGFAGSGKFAGTGPWGNFASGFRR